MGEKQGKGGDNKEKPAPGGEGEKKQQKQQDGSKGEGGGGDGKGKKDGPLTVVLKVDMHCDGCAKKIKRSVRAFDGVEMVTADASTGKLTAVGKVDPWKLREHVEVKTHKKVVLVSPTDAPKKKEEAKKEDKKDGDKDKGGGGGGEKKKDDKAPKEATVVLKIRLHCEGCIKRIRRTILRFQGVDSVSVDNGKDQVTVKGTMDVKAMVLCLTEKLKRGVEIVQPKKDDGGGKGKGGGDGDKKKEAGGGDEKGAKAAAAAVAEANKLDYIFSNYGGAGGGYAVPASLGGHAGYQFLQQQQQLMMQQQQQQMMMHGGFPFGGQQPQQMFPQHYQVAPIHHMPHPPQLFSDENPNACSIM